MKDRRLKSTLKQKEENYSQAVKQAAKSEYLLTEESGYVVKYSFILSVIFVELLKLWQKKSCMHQHYYHYDNYNIKHFHSLDFFRFLEVEGTEKTHIISQRALKESVDITSAQKVAFFLLSTFI